MTVPGPRGATGPRGTTGSSGPTGTQGPRGVELPYTTAELITHWGDAYAIETGERCRARRRDGQGGWLEADGPDALYLLIRDDYQRERVPRQFDPPPR